MFHLHKCFNISYAYLPWITGGTGIFKEKFRSEINLFSIKEVVLSTTQWRLKWIWKKKKLHPFQCQHVFIRHPMLTQYCPPSLCGGDVIFFVHKDSKNKIFLTITQNLSKFYRKIYCKISSSYVEHSPERGFTLKKNEKE